MLIGGSDVEDFSETDKQNLTALSTLTCGVLQEEGIECNPSDVLLHYCRVSGLCSLLSTCSTFSTPLHRSSALA